MGSKGGGEVKETAEQRAVAAIAAESFRDYEKRWVPIENEMIRQIRDVDDDIARAGEVSMSGTTQAFGAMRPAVEKGLAAARAAPGSGRFYDAESGLTVRQGASGGLNMAASRQGMRDRALSNLSNVVAMGRGQEAEALTGLSHQASISGQEAITDAARAASDSAAFGTFVGTAAGFGLGAYRPGPAAPAPAGAPAPAAVPTLDTTPMIGPPG